MITVRNIAFYVLGIVCIGTIDANNIHSAVRKGDYHKVKQLLQSGHVSVDLMGVEKNTPLSIAVFKGDYDICDLLIAHGADVNTNGNVSPFNLEQGTYFDIEYNVTPMDIFVNPLHLAAARGFCDIGKLLIDSGARINVKDGNGKAPLYIAAMNNRYNFCKMLMRYEADIDASDLCGKTPLHIASECADEHVCKLLMSYEVDIRRQDNMYGTPLHGAAAKGQYNVCKFLIGYGADINERPSNQPAPFLHAVSSGYYDTCKTLLELGVSIENASGSAMFTPNVFLMAYMKEYRQIASLLEKAQRIQNGSIALYELQADNDINIALGYGQFGYVQNMLRDVCNNWKDPTSVYAEALLHAETLRAMCSQPTPQLDACITNMLYSVAVAQRMIPIVQKRVDDGSIDPATFTCICERYKAYFVSEAPKKLQDGTWQDDHIAMCQSIYNMICKHDITLLADRIFHQEATCLEIATAIRHCMKKVKRYYDRDTGNTFLHELARTPRYMQFVPAVASVIIGDTYHDSRNHRGETPVMIARKHNNKDVVAMFYACFQLDKRVRFLKKYRDRQAQREQSSYHACKKIKRSDAEASSFPETLPYSVKWDIIGMNYANMYIKEQ